MRWANTQLLPTASFPAFNEVFCRELLYRKMIGVVESEKLELPTDLLYWL